MTTLITHTLIDYNQRSLLHYNQRSRLLFHTKAAGSFVLKVGKPREKIVDSAALKQYLHQSGKLVRVISEQQDDIKEDLASGLREVRDGIKHKMRTIDTTMLKELKRLRVSARKEMKKSPFAEADAAIAAQVSWFYHTYYHLLTVHVIDVLFINIPY